MEREGAYLLTVASGAQEDGENPAIPLRSGGIPKVLPEGRDWHDVEAHEAGLPTGDAVGPRGVAVHDR